MTKIKDKVIPISNPEPTKFKDYIIEKPEVVIEINPEKRSLLKEHRKIFGALSAKGNLTVKEIHAIFWDPMQTKYEKSMKTIYRYMDLLENAKLVKIAGHRKQENSRMIEKLYCRSALLYYDKETPSMEKWWKTPEYERIIQKSIDFFILYKNLPEGSNSKLKSLMESFIETRVGYINNQLKDIKSNPEFVKFFSDLSGMEMKSIITDVALFQIFMHDKKIIEGFRQLKGNIKLK